MKTKDMVLTALFTALIIVGAFIRIPMPTVPLTLQWFFVMMAGIILGPKLGALSAGLYVLLGLIGIPVFAGGGGIWYVFQPTFGYSIGFIITAFLIGHLSRKGMNLFASCAIGTAVLYVIGASYGYVILNFFTEGEGIGLWALVFSYMVLPLPGDILKIVLAALTGKRLKAVLD